MQNSEPLKASPSQPASQVQSRVQSRVQRLMLAVIQLQDMKKTVDIWVPQTDGYSQAAAIQLRAEGRDMWWYICTGPWHPSANFFVEYPAIEARLLMGLMAYMYQTGGFLYYNIAKWLSVAHQPGGWITSGPYTTWDPRSGSLGAWGCAHARPCPDRPLRDAREAGGHWRRHPR